MCCWMGGNMTLKEVVHFHSSHRSPSSTAVNAHATHLRPISRMAQQWRCTSHDTQEQQEQQEQEQWFRNLVELEHPAVSLAELAHLDQLGHGGATGVKREASWRSEAAQNASPRHKSRSSLQL